MKIPIQQLDKYLEEGEDLQMSKKKQKQKDKKLKKDKIEPIKGYSSYSTEELINMLYASDKMHKD